MKLFSKSKLLTRWTFWTALVVVVALAGCAVGPNYKPPKTRVGDAFAGSAETNFTTAETEIAWWRGFNDPKLNSLVDRALAGNKDLRIASANVLEARALRQNAQFDLAPAPQAQASYSDSLYSQAFEPGVPISERHLKLYDVGFDATWELDFFGRVRRSVQANTAEWEAAKEQRRDVMVTLISEVARNYFEMLGAKGELEVARLNAKNQLETVKITEARTEGGRGTDLDVARAKAQLNNTLANIPPLEAAEQRSNHRLGVLLGLQPNALKSELADAKPVVNMPPLIALSNPAELLRRRPDIRVAERQLAAATDRIGIARADLFPRVTFNGNIGLQASSIAGLTKGGSDTYSFGPSITWAALDFGHVQARMKAAGAQADAQLAVYQKTVLMALEETENSLVDFSREESRNEYLKTSENESETAARLARERFENGATDFLTVLDAQRVLYESQDELAKSNYRTATALVAIYKSLGGGWEIEELPSKVRDAGH